MKKIKYVIAFIIMSFIVPLYAYAAGSITVSPSSVSVDNGNSASFKIKATNAAGKVTIKSNDTSIATVNKSSEWIENQTITVTVKGTKIGSTKITITVDAATFDEEEIKKTYTVNVNVTKPKSSNNNLSTLTVDGKQISGFSTNKTNYNMVVENNISEVTIGATTADNTAKLSGTGAKKLNVYSNRINVVVTAENGTKKTYTINISRKDENGKTSKPSSNTNLKSLIVEGYEIKFNKTTTDYTIDVPQTVSTIKVKAEAEDSKSTVSINQPDTLKLGTNIISITVTSETGDTKTYKIAVNREDGTPRTTLKDLLTTLESVESDTIIVDIKDDNNTITKEMLDKVKSLEKTLIINKYINEALVYSWEIRGIDIKETKDINTLVEFKSSSDKKINELTNNGRYIYLKNNLDTTIFTRTKLKLYVEDLYNGEVIYGHMYTNDELTEKFNDLRYNENYIEIVNIETGEYVLNQPSNTKCNNCIIYIIIMIVEGIVIIALIVLLALLLKKFDEKGKITIKPSKEIKIVEEPTSSKKNKNQD